MNLKKIKAEFNKLMQDKKVTNLIIGVMICALVLVFINAVSPQLVKMFGSNESIPDDRDNAKNTIANTATSYEEKERQELISILEQIDGVGKVDVKISYESGESKEIAYDQNSQTTRNEETDTQGGKRVTDGKNDGTKVVMSNNGGNTEPIIIKTYTPKVRSVFVVAEGANGSKIKYELQKAVANLFDVSLDKVNVYPMK